MIGSFDFYPIGGKGQLTEPVNTCFLHLAPDETSTLVCVLIGSEPHGVWFLFNRRQRRLAGFMGFGDNIYDFVDRIFDRLNAIPCRIPRICLIYSR